MGLSTGHLVQLFVEHGGLVLRDRTPAWVCWRLRRTGEIEARQYYSTLYHIEEVTGRQNSTRVLAIAVSHEGQNPWTYEIPFCKHLTHGSIGVTELTGIELTKRVSRFGGFLEVLGNRFTGYVSDKIEGQVDMCKYLGNNLLCSLVTVGLKQEARIITLTTGEVICSTDLKQLEHHFSYTVSLD